MLQQVNLYQPIFRKEKKVISAQSLLEVGAIALVIMSVFHFVGISRVSDLKRTVDANTLQAAEEEIKLKEMKASLPKQEKDKLLQQQLARLEKEFVHKQNILTALSDSSVYGNKTGFSEVLSGFSRQHTDDVWLESIEIEQGGTYLKLQGNAVSPRAVPVYIQSLSDDRVFTGMEFDVFNLAKKPGPDLNPYISFTLQSNKK